MTTSFVLIELFGGILIGSTACAQLNLNVIATYYSEILEDAIKVASTLFPDAVSLGDITTITDAVVTSIIQLFPESIFVIMGGPPCQDVILLNEDRDGAMGSRSVYREEFLRVYSLFQSKLPDSQIRVLMECVVMDDEDRVHYDSVFNSSPFHVDASNFDHITRPRWWWFSVPPAFEGATLVDSANGVTTVSFSGQRTHWSKHILPGWQPCQTLQAKDDSFRFSCLTRHIPRRAPIRIHVDSADAPNRN